MKKVLFVLAVVLLAACGSATTEAPTQDSLTSTTTDSVAVDSLKEVK